MKIIDIILNVIYPPVCGFCNEINSNFLCNKCKNRLNSIKKSQIDDYKNAPVYFDEHFYLFKYENETRDNVLKYKFDEKSYMYKTYAELFIQDEVFRNSFINKYDYIVSVPIHKKRLKQRGYNQSELIAKELGKMCGKQYCNNALVKTKNIVAQSSLYKLDRVRNIKDAYDFGKNALLIKNKKVAIFDDVFTTGSTVNECAKVLKQNGVSYVGVFTIAKT